MTSSVKEKSGRRSSDKVYQVPQLDIGRKDRDKAQIGPKLNARKVVWI